MSGFRRALITVLLLANGAVAVPVYGQVARPPAGGPDWTSIGPPTGNAQDFLGTWTLTWDGPIDFNCPCHGTLTIQPKETADGSGFAGYWKMKGPTAVLQGAVAFDQNAWVGRFAQPDDSSDYPMRGNFRLETRGANALTGSYQPEGTTIPFRWSGIRN